LTNSGLEPGETPLRCIEREAPILLGSASPRRREILTALGLPFVVRPADVDERQLANDTPQTFLTRVAADKLRAAETRQGSDVFSCVLVADTIVVLGDRILGKPKDRDDAAQLVGALVGQTHTVFTRFGWSWASRSGVVRRFVTARSEVTMRKASSAEVRAYAASGEGLDKAGAYAVQGLGAFLVSRLEGSFSNVVGLPACEVVEELTKVGLLLDFPRVF
jgi:septum formation protein